MAKISARVENINAWNLTYANNYYLAQQKFVRDLAFTHYFCSLCCDIWYHRLRSLLKLSFEKGLNQWGWNITVKNKNKAKLQSNWRFITYQLVQKTFRGRNPMGIRRHYVCSWVFKKLKTRTKLWRKITNLIRNLIRN